MCACAWRAVFLIIGNTVCLGKFGWGLGGASFASFSPKINSFLPLIGLAFPILFALNLCFLIYWLIQLKWKSLIPAAFFLFNLGQMNFRTYFPTPPVLVCSVNGSVSGYHTLSVSNVTTTSFNITSTGGWPTSGISYIAICKNISSTINPDDLPAV
jgi:hypothetical protein